MIRKCREEDLSAIIELSNEWIKEDITIGYENVKHTFETLGNKLGDYFFVLEHKGRIVGYTFGEIKLNPTPVFDRDEKYLEIYEIYINQNHRDQGQGKLLIDAIKSEAKQHNVAHLLVGSSNKKWHRTVKFYEELGFKMWYVQMYQ